MLYSMLCLKQRRAFRNSTKADGYQIPSNPVSPERHLDFPKILLLILNIINVLLRNRYVFVLLRTVFSLNAKFHCCKHLITIFMLRSQCAIMFRAQASKLRQFSVRTMSLYREIKLFTQTLSGRFRAHLSRCISAVKHLTPNVFQTDSIMSIGDKSKLRN